MHGSAPTAQARQLGLDFTSRTADALAKIRAAGQRLADQLPPDVAAGLVDLLERVCLTAHDHTTSHARASRLAAGLHDRRAVSERTIRRWRAAAETFETAAGPLLAVDRPSSRHGGHRPNAWTINWPAVALVARGAPPTRPLATSPPARPADPPLDPPPARPTPTAADPWAQLTDQLLAQGLRTARHICQAAKAAGETPANCQARVDRALATAQANRAQFQDPLAAAAYFLSRGSWPADPQRMIDPAAQARAQDRRRADQLDLARESTLAQLARQGRQAGLDDAAILPQLLAAGLPAAWLASRGWHAAPALAAAAN